MINNFTVWKVDKKDSDKSPDYKAMVKVNDKWIEVAAGWTKSAGEKKYISFSLKKTYQDKPGWELSPLLPTLQEAPRVPDERVAESDRGIRNEDITFEQPTDSAEEEFNNYGN